MRNLKKVLSLALALVMLVGMMVVGAGAATYGDSASVTKTEAVDVMYGIGVFTGNDAGNFNPAGYLNRQEAAKIIATVTLGPAVASRLSVSGTGFSDVPAGSWASGYIAYCASENIISGSDGKFRPYDLLEATDFAKMLLIAAGKDPANYVGNGWNLNVQKDALNSGLLTNVTMGAWFDPITRENAAQMALNAIQVSPNGETTTYVVKASAAADAATLYRGTDAVTAALVKTLNAGSVMSTDTVSTGSLADRVFGLSKTTTTSDAFGRPTTTWTSTKDPSLKVVVNTGATKTYTTAVSPSQIFNDLGLKETVSGVAVKTDGVSSTVTLDRATTTKNIGAVGATTEVYKAADGTVSISVVTNYLAKVTTVNAAKAATATAAAVPASVTVEVYGLGTSGATVAGLTFQTAAFAKDQYVVVNVKKDAATATNASTIQSMEAAVPVEGVMTAYNGDTSLTVNGAAMPIAAAASQSSNAKRVAPASISIGFQNTWTYYTKDGVILGGELKQSAVSTDYVYVVSTQAQFGTGTLFGTTGNAVKADVVFAADGTHAVVDLAIGGTASAPSYAKPAANGTVSTITFNASENATQPVGNWFAYTVNDGKYTLQALTAGYAASVDPDTIQAESGTSGQPGYKPLIKGVALTANTPKALTANGTKYTTSTTQIVTIDAKYNRSVATGLVKADLTGKVLVTYAPGSNIVSALVAVGQPAPVQTAANYAYAVKKGNTTALGDVWTFAVNGAQADFVIATGQSVTAGKVYTLNTGANNTFTVTEVGNTNTGSHVVTVAQPGDGFFITDEKVWTKSTTGFAVYDVSSDASVKGELGTLEAQKSVVVIGAESTAAVVYIVDTPASAGDASLGTIGGTTTLVEGVNNTETLTAPTFTANTSGLTVSSSEWKSSATGVATVNSSGLVTFVADGTATITYTATLSNGAKLEKTATITCTGAKGATVSVSATAPTTTTGTDGSATATFAANSSGLTASSYEWSSSVEAKATVSGSSENATITGVAAGDTVITCTVTLSNGAKISGTATITVPG